MALFFIGYDLNTPGQNYDALYETLKSAGAIRIQDSLWALKSTWTALQIKNALVRTVVDANDSVFVVECAVRDGNWAWAAHRLVENPNRLAA